MEIDVVPDFDRPKQICMPTKETSPEIPDQRFEGNTKAFFHPGRKHSVIGSVEVRLRFILLSSLIEKNPSRRSLLG